MKKFLLLAVAALMCCTMTACGGDDNGNGGGNEDGASFSLVGKWRTYFSSGYIDIVFNANNTGYLQEYDSLDGGWYEKEHFQYFYNPQEEEITIRFTDGDDSFTGDLFFINKDKFILYNDVNEEEVYVRIN